MPFPPKFSEKYPIIITRILDVIKINELKGKTVIDIVGTAMKINRLIEWHFSVTGSLKVKRSKIIFSTILSVMLLRKKK